MTPGGTALPDAQLVALVREGDRDAFAQVYDRYADRLYDFAHSMLRSRDDAADAVADAFVTTAEKLGQLRNPERLRPWLYSVVRRECLARLKDRSRVAHGGDEVLVAMADDRATPGEQAEQEELRKLVWDASAGLGDRDRAVLDLHLRHGLEGADLGEAMGITANNAYVMLNRLRTQVERSLGALLIARLGRDDCGPLDDLLQGWDGRFSPLIRKRVARHVDKCPTCSATRTSMVSPWALLASIPLLGAPAALRSRVLEDPRLVSFLGPIAGAASVPAAPGPPRAAAGRDRRAAVARGGAAALIVAVLATLAILAVTVWPDNAPVAKDPTPSDSASVQSTRPPMTVVPHVPGITVSREPTPDETTTTPPATTSAPPPPTTAPPQTSQKPDKPKKTKKSKTPAPTTSAPPPDEKPSVGTISVTQDPNCGIHVIAQIQDDGAVVSATADWAITGNGGSGSMPMTDSGGGWTAFVDDVYPGNEESITVTVTATDDAGQQGSGSTQVALDPCG